MTEVLAQGLASIIQYLGATPVLLAVTVWVLGPMVAVVWVVYKLGRQAAISNATTDRRMQDVFARQDERFEQVVKMFEHGVQMYKDNVQLVKEYERHVDSQRETNDKLIDLVSISTATQQTLVEYIKNNWWCPVAKDPRLLQMLKKENA